MKKDFNKNIYRLFLKTYMMRNCLNQEEVKAVAGCNKELLNRYFSGDINSEENERWIEQHLKTCLFCMEDYREMEESREYQIRIYRGVN